MPHALPPLPYDYSALEPHIDEQTMRLHHDKHHQAYVDGLNAAEKKLAEMRQSSDYAAVQAVQRAVAFHGSGHYNHVVFWENMGPDGGGTPSGDLGSQIDKDFGSFDKFKAHFSAAAATVEGNGWGVLAWHPVNGQLYNISTDSHADGPMWFGVPLVVIDMYEHSYYIDYQNKKADYVDGFMRHLNWAEIDRRVRATGG